jgi:hypothetical protein
MRLSLPRRRTLIVALAAIIGLLVVCHGPLLRGLVAWLIVDETRGPVDVVLVMAGPDSYRSAARWIAEQRADRVLLFQVHPNRLVRTGVLPPEHVLIAQSLEHLGIPKQSIEVDASPPYQNSLQWTKAYGNWMTEHPSATAVLLVPRLSGRSIRNQLRQTISSDVDHRTFIVGEPDPILDEARWWHSWVGLKFVGNSLVHWAGSWGRLRDYRPIDWDIDEYENNLRKHH